MWGKLTVTWVAHDIRDQIVDFVRHWSERTEIAGEQLLRWIELSSRKFRDWRARYGKANEHNDLVPRDHWLEVWEKQKILAFYQQYPLEGYRRLAFMMLDRDLVAVSPSSVYRVLKAEGLLADRWRKPTRKGAGFVQPLAPHEHWHVDFCYVNVAGTFYYLCNVLDGASRYLVAWDIREAMKEADAEIVLQRGREKFPQARPRVISDRGSQFVAREFREFIRLWQTTHVLTSPHYPQSNGKLERFHRTLKEQAIRAKTPLSLEDARRVVGEFVQHYNTVRLHSAIGYVTPQDKLEGRAEAILALRDERLERARQARAQRRGEATNQDGQRDNKFLQSGFVGAEDRATQGCDPSADSGLQTAVGGGLVPPLFSTAGAADKAINPRGSGGQSHPRSYSQRTKLKPQQPVAKVS